MAIPHVNVKQLKVAELKEQLELRGLETTGLKKDVSSSRHTRPLHAHEQLADRLQTAQDLDKSAGTELAPDASVDDALPPKEAAEAIADMAKVMDESTKETNGGAGDANEEPEPLPQGVVEVVEDGAGGVGDVMVDHEPSAATGAEVHETASTEPVALDAEVAEVVAEEEAKDALPPSPKAISPVSTPAEAPTNATSPAAGQLRPRSPSLPPSPAAAEEPRSGASKRPASPSPHDASEAGPSKRQRRRSFPPLPDTLSHLIHPPTSILYISNLRRPLLLPTLHNYVFTDSSPRQEYAELLPSPKGPFASTDYPGLWLSGIKSHAYAVFASVEQATAAAARMEGVQWPEDTGAELRVEFVDEDVVKGLVEREEFAWTNGRQKLTLKVAKKGSDQAEYDFYFEGGSGGQTTRPAPGVRGAPSGPAAGPSSARAPAVLGGANGVPLLGPRGMPIMGRGGAPGGPAGMNIRGLGSQTDRQPPPHLRDAPMMDGRPGPPGRPSFGNEGGRGQRPRYAMRGTKTRPRLFWKEGPGAAAAA